MLTKLDTLVFDKTGTLTEPVVQTQFFSSPDDADTIIQWAASLENSFASHPIALAIIAANRKKLCAVQDAKMHPSSQGVIGMINDKKVIVGSLALLHQENCVISLDIRRESEKLQATGFTPVFIAIEGKCQGVLGLKHQLKPHVASTLQHLKKQGFKLMLLTGDHTSVTNVLAKDLPFDQVYSEKSAQQKRDIIQGLVNTKHKVGFIGDGLNDMEAIDAAHMGIAIQSWTHLASKAHLCLKGSIRELPKSIELASLVQTNIKQNLAWTFFYNTLSLLVASGALYPLIGFSLNPIIFAAMMGISSLVVIANSLRVPTLLDQQCEKNPKCSQNILSLSSTIYPATLTKEAKVSKKPKITHKASNLLPLKSECNNQNKKFTYNF
ncbi:MAG TPA: HAD-IC family P-type ATPase, partial [Gammaproteobacteria bacterium]|nr:HAD-IC family P-type ATPase [Gammaproteobacteria bacterium]